MHSHSQAEASPRSSLKRRLAPQQLIAGTHKRRLAPQQVRRPLASRTLPQFPLDYSTSRFPPLQLREFESAHLRSRITALLTGSLARKSRPAALVLLKVLRICNTKTGLPHRVRKNSRAGHGPGQHIIILYYGWSSELLDMKMMVQLPASWLA